jgi:hypothetical protein
VLDPKVPADGAPAAGAAEDEAPKLNPVELAGALAGAAVDAGAAKLNPPVAGVDVAAVEEPKLNPPVETDGAGVAAAAPNVNDMFYSTHRTPVILRNSMFYAVYVKKATHFWFS